MTNEKYVRKQTILRVFNFIIYRWKAKGLKNIYLTYKVLEDNGE